MKRTTGIIAALTLTALVPQAMSGQSETTPQQGTSNTSVVDDMCRGTQKLLRRLAEASEGIGDDHPASPSEQLRSSANGAVQTIIDERGEYQNPSMDALLLKQTGKILIKAGGAVTALERAGEASNEEKQAAQESAKRSIGSLCQTVANTEVKMYREMDRQDEERVNG
ncbi:MAG: hypothetical protein LBJ69_02970 [Holosporales bacterium]|jgi:hypothetical protein|nr:hypothetical protein [Holosporales bacterium]